MYIAVPRAAASSAIDPVVTSVSFIAALPVRASWLADVLRIALRWLWKCLWHFMGDLRTLIVRAVTAIRAYPTTLKPSIDYFLNKIVTLLLDWPTTSFELVAYIVRQYPHPVHVTAWLIFFGPLAIICPILLLYEVCIAIIFNLTFFFHGLIPGSVERNYLELRERTDDAKQWMFVYVEQATNTYNKWTMESNPLLVVRLVAGATGLYILYRICRHQS
ncbi:hypothetical protein AX14_009292 [Amanita brunnescens Koide BX004]|nr:hypothetical protein AX14_009292 [Amanita brunnescens Koide BX004]